jgi:hypothetical protein
VKEEMQIKMEFVMIGIENLDTPIGARVDGAGKALDMDFEWSNDLTMMHVMSSDC